MTIPARIYIVLVSSSAMLFIASLRWADVLTLTLADAAGVAVLVALGILAEKSAVDFAVDPRRRVKSSITFVPLFACAVVFPPPVTVVACVAVVSFAEFFLRERVLWKASFNISQYVLAYGFAAALYHTFRRETLAGAEVDVLAFLGLAIVFFVSNILLVSTLYSIRQRLHLLSLIRQAIGPAGGNLWYDLLASPIAIIAAILYGSFGVGGLVLIVLPLLLIRYSYLSKLQLQQANRDLLRVLIKAIETRDPYTSGHSLRVSTLARVIAEDLRVSHRKVEKIETAALLHDIGKIDAVYAPLIRKPSPLDQDERSVIRTHATKGADLLESLASLEAEVIKGVRHHHERYNGTGYPEKLMGKAIPLPARIIALCDAIDAMLSDRPYRRALTTEQVRAELVNGSGEQFDPDIVEVILRENTIERAAALLSESNPALAPEPTLQPA